MGKLDTHSRHSRSPHFLLSQASVSGYRTTHNWLMVTSSETPPVRNQPMRTQSPWEGAGRCPGLWRSPSTERQTESRSDGAGGPDRGSRGCNLTTPCVSRKVDFLRNSIQCVCVCVHTCVHILFWNFSLPYKAYCSHVQSLPISSPVTSTSKISHLCPVPSRHHLPTRANHFPQESKKHGGLTMCLLSLFIDSYIV